MKTRIGWIARCGLTGTAAVCCVVLCPGLLRAATVSTGGSGGLLPTAPSGFSGAATGAPQVYQGGLLEGLSIITTLSAYYDTNVTRSPGGAVAPIEDDFILGPGFSLGYLTKARTWTFGANYHGRYDEYFNHSDFSGYNQGGGVVANYEGRRLSATMNAGAEINRGANTYYSSAFVEQMSYHAGISARYRLSPKTFLEGHISDSFNTTTNNRYSDTQSFDTGLSALWKYSPLTEFGPGLRYAYRTGGNNVGLTSIGPTLSVNYKLSTKVSLSSRVGVDFSSYSTGASADPSVSASIGLDYRASKLWGMNLSIYRDSQADPSVAGRFIETTSVRLGYNRKVHRATLNLGVGYQMDTYSAPGMAAGTVAPDRDALTFDASIGMPIFANKCDASVFIRQIEQNGSRRDSYSSFQTGFFIGRKF